MSFPNDFDDDTTIPFVNDNLTEIGGEAINGTRDAVFGIEQNIGLNAQGSMPTIGARLDVSLFPDGTIKPSAITSLGLVTLPITEDQIADWANIPERKLRLDHRTADLFNYILDLSKDVNFAKGWIGVTGVKLEPHLAGALYKHELADINVSDDANSYLFNNKRLLRNNSSAYGLIDDMNDELLAHQWADGSPLPAISFIMTNDGSTYPDNYAHTAGGIFLNTSRFATIPQTTDDVQALAEFIDSTSIFLLGTRLQNLYSNGISRESRSSSLLNDGYGSPVIPVTAAIAYLKNLGNSSSPVDNINTGDDIIEFTPSATVMNNNTFDEKFALVKIGDIIRVNYGTVEVAFVIKEAKYIQSGGNKKYIVRIAGKNIQYAPNAFARIDKPLVNTNKYAVLALAAANSGDPTVQSSLIAVNPRGAQALGIGFNADQFDELHYLLYLALYPTGIPDDGYLILPPIDVTGNLGATPGSYTIASVVEATNNAFRQAGYNYRFNAFQYQGEFGIALSDSVNNAGFSILNAVITDGGALDPVGTAVTFPNNVVGVFATLQPEIADPLGFGSTGAAIASPAYQTSYASAEASQFPTKLFLPLKRNNYYVNGTEREKMNYDIDQVLDTYGDGYWPATIVSQSIIPGSPGTVQTTYRVQLDLSASQLKKGKTLVVQSLDGYGTFPNDFGRFIISDVALGCCSPSSYTDIQVLDAVHGLATSGASGLALGIGGEVRLYFSSDSVSLNVESATDYSSVSPFKRHFETYVDENGNTFTHERGRFNAGNISPLVINEGVPLVNYSELVKINIVKISPKLRGYQFGSVTKITFNLNSYNTTTGIYDGYLSSWNGNLSSPAEHLGPTTTGKRGQVTRLYDETYVDYIDVIFDFNTAVSSFSGEKLDFQLFPTLSLDNQIMMIGTFQYNDVTNVINYVRDERQFGNISEKDLTTSALNYIAAGERLLHGNGVIRGFELAAHVGGDNPGDAQVYFTGGEVLVNGKFFQLNDETVQIPICKEATPGFAVSNINWLVCINDTGEYRILPLLDRDPVLNTPSNTSRAFVARNLVNGLTYNLDATTFSNAINNRKDLTPLYILGAQTTVGTPPTITMGAQDVRKFVNDGDTILPLKLTTSVAQGNFRSLAQVLNWIKYNNAFNGDVIVRGATTTNATVNTPVELHFDANVIIDGQNEATLTFDHTLTLGSNLTLKNMTINCNNGLFTKSGVSIENLIIENCNLVITIPFSFINTDINNQVILNFVTGNNIQFKNTNIEIVWEKTLLAPSPATNINQYPTVFRLNNTHNFLMDNCFVSVEYNTASPGVVAPGGMFVILNNSFAPIIKNSNFQGNMNRVFAINTSNSVHITGNILSSSYNPMSDFGYSANDFVNSGQGWIYADVNTTLDDLVIDNNTFYYLPDGDPTLSTNQANRFSFINLELSSVTSVLSNLKVTNCQFFHQSATGLVDDVRPAVSIINKYSAISVPVTANSQQPIVLNAEISNNTCNKNQSIIITSRLDSGNLMNYPGLAAQGCVVKNNVCGIIGYWVSNALKTLNLTPNFNSLPDKLTNLSIDNNVCHYIYNTDHTGAYFFVSKLVDGYSSNRSVYPSGHVTVKHNKANWIHVGVAYEEDSSMAILSNVLSAYDAAFINQFGDTDGYAYGGSNGYAIFVSANKYTMAAAQSPSEGNDSSVLISGNITNQGYWYQIVGISANYQYPNGCIFSQSSCVITDNTLRGANGGDLIKTSGVHNIIKGNKIYRGTANITSYVRFDSFDNPSWGGDPDGEGNGSTGLIVDNFFDQPYPNSFQIDSFNGVSFNGNINITQTAAPGWVVERNKNQIGWAVVSLTDGHLQYHNTQGTGYGPDGYDSLYLMQASDQNALPYRGGYRSGVIRVRDNESIGFRMWGIQSNIEQYLPNGVTLLEISSAIRSFGTQVDYDPLESPTAASTSNFWMNLSSHDVQNIGYGVTELDQYSSINSFDAGISELTTPVFSKVSGDDFNATAFGIPFSIDLTNYSSADISSRYITGRGRAITIAFDLRWSRFFGVTNFLLSPVLVKYKW